MCVPLIYVCGFIVVLCVGGRRIVALVVYLHAVVMGTFSIEMAAMVVDTAVIQGAEAHEAMLQGVVPLLVHVVVPDYILFTGKPLQKGRGENVQQQVGVYLNQSQNQQQVTLSMKKQQLQHAGASWQLRRDVHPALERTGRL